MKARAPNLGGAGPAATGGLGRASCYHVGGLGRASGEPARPQKEALRLRALSEPRDEGVLSTVRKKLHNTKDVEAKKKLVRSGRKGLEGWGGRGWAAGWVEGLGC